MPPGIVGPAIGAGVVSVAGLTGPFVAGAAIFIGGAIVIAARPSRDRVPVTDQG